MKYNVELNIYFNGSNQLVAMLASGVDNGTAFAIQSLYAPVFADNGTNGSSNLNYTVSISNPF